MTRLAKRMGLPAFVATCFLLVGCLISGTFVVTIFVEDEEFTTDNGFYYYFVDLTDNEDWEDHQDNIDNIDVVGFELWIDNTSGSATTFDVWIDDAGNAELMSLAAVQASATKIVDGLTIANGANFITYGQSLGVIQNTETLKTLVEAGEFHYYGYSSAGMGLYEIDSMRVIVTVSASD